MKRRNQVLPRIHITGERMKNGAKPCRVVAAVSNGPRVSRGKSMNGPRPSDPPAVRDTEDLSYFDAGVAVPRRTVSTSSPIPLIRGHLRRTRGANQTDGTAPERLRVGAS